MELKLQKRLAAHILGCSKKRVVFRPERLEDIKEAITKTDIRLLIGEGAIRSRPEKGVSRVRANQRKRQERKGLRKGEGKRKGSLKARQPPKQVWMRKVRAQRKFISELRSKQLIAPVVYRDLYKKAKGGFFRSINHIKIYLNERDLITRKKQEKQTEKKTEKKPATEKKQKEKKQEKARNQEKTKTTEKKKTSKPKSKKAEAKKSSKAKKAKK